MNTLKINQAEILNPTFDCHAALTQTAVRGYAFCTNVILPGAREAMEEEVSKLAMELGDHVKEPINEEKTIKVTQLHERAYRAIHDWEVPVATKVSTALVRRICQIVSRLSDPNNPLHSLDNWAPSEAGYQRYRSASDHISPHRDRRSDQLLGATITVNGRALVRIHDPTDDPDDYSCTKVIDRFETSPGSIMFLRAPGLSSGEQVIHEVISPQQGSRLILNLRMRPDVLKNLQETENECN